MEAETDSGRHLVLAGTRGRHRLLITAPASYGGYIVPADRSMGVRLAALSAFHEDQRGRPVKAAFTALKPSAYQRHRLVLLLSILDRLSQSPPTSATTRRIAGDLIFPGRTFERAIDWKSSSHRRQTQRLVAEARRMSASGYRDLLHGRTRPDSILRYSEDRDARESEG